jgi:glycosyltransferase involved in cell wall biosynthesis
MNLSFVMATYKDSINTRNTVQHLRQFHWQDGDDIVVVDNKPDDAEHAKVLTGFLGQVRAARYIAFPEPQGTAAPRDYAIRAAKHAVVVCMDPHVTFEPNAIEAVRHYFEERPDCKDIVNGPMLYDNLNYAQASTHFADEWRDRMHGTWATDARGVGTEPFEILAQGLGAFAVRKAAWPGFNPNFRGFGGEEHYIHEKVRRAGGKVVCIPQFRWNHCFYYLGKKDFLNTDYNKARNYIIGHRELGWSLKRVRKHFVDECKVVTPAQWERLMSSDPPPEKPCCDGGAKGAVISHPATVDEWYEKARQTPSDLYEYAPLLRDYAAKSDVVMELGGRRAVSTVALLAAKPKEVITVDTVNTPEVAALKGLAKGTKYKFLQMDPRGVVDPGTNNFAPLAGLDECDTCFVHNAAGALDLAQRLANVRLKVRKYILIHGTTQWWNKGRDNSIGYIGALMPFLQNNKEWTAINRFENNGGMLVLSRLPEDRDVPPGVAEKVANFSWSMLEHFAKGGKQASEATVKHRLELCLLCKHRVVGNCGVCGCPLEKKLALATSRCPLGDAKYAKYGEPAKWEAET